MDERVPKGKKPEDESSLGEKTEGHNLIQK